MPPTPGILYVTMQPSATLPPAQFHDWYNNEHGPARLRLPFIPAGSRYRATDVDDPAGGAGEAEWLAVYDVADMAALTRAAYTRLRTDAVQSRREVATMAQVAVGRALLDHVRTWQVEGGYAPPPPEAARREEEEDEEAGVLVAVSVRLHPGREKAAEEELERWYADEHVPRLARVPGWRRSRRFVTSSSSSTDPPRHEIEHLALHEYAPENGLDCGEAFRAAAAATPWNERIQADVIRAMRRRVYRLAYTFGAAPRDLAAVASADAVAFVSPDGKTRTQRSSSSSSSSSSTGGGGAIESFVTTPDGVELAYRLEGCSDAHAPLLLLSNAILVAWDIWTPFLDAFCADPANRKYRVLRYHTRGRTGACGSRPITVDVLAADMVALLDALRVPAAAAVMGVSLGGATALHAALQYPNRFASVVSCDTSAKSPAGNRKTWGDRIEMAEKEGAESQGELVVGEQLAEATVRRWFVEGSYDGAGLEKRIGEVRAMVASNSLVGFKRSVEALFEYDLRGEMERENVKGAFVVGSGDGVLPGTMKEMAAALKGAEYHVVDDAGHLPMVEKPEDFARIVTQFLAQ